MPQGLQREVGIVFLNAWLFYPSGNRQNAFSLTVITINRREAAIWLISLSWSFIFRSQTWIFLMTSPAKFHFVAVWQMSCWLSSFTCLNGNLIPIFFSHPILSLQIYWEQRHPSPVKAHIQRTEVSDTSVCIALRSQLSVEVTQWRYTMQALIIMKEKS